MFRSPLLAKLASPTGVSLSMDVPPQVGITSNASIAFSVDAIHYTLVFLYTNGSEITRHTYNPGSSGGLLASFIPGSAGQTITAVARRMYFSTASANDSNDVTAPETYVVLP